MMRLIWAPLAVKRLQQAAEFIAADNPWASRRWARGLFDRVGQLSDHPNMGRVVPEVGRMDLREILHGKYRVIYRVGKEAFFVLTVRHCRRLLDLGEVDE